MQIAWAFLVAAPLAGEPACPARGAQPWSPHCDPLGAAGPWGLCPLWPEGLGHVWGMGRILEFSLPQVVVPGRQGQERCGGQMVKKLGKNGEDQVLLDTKL